MAATEQLNHAKNYLKKAEEYLASAEDNLIADRFTAAAGDAIHAGINAKDAIATALTGSTTKGRDHATAATELRRALGQPAGGECRRTGTSRPGLRQRRSRVRRIPGHRDQGRTARSARTHAGRARGADRTDRTLRRLPSSLDSPAQPAVWQMIRDHRPEFSIIGGTYPGTSAGGIRPATEPDARRAVRRTVGAPESAGIGGLLTVIPLVFTSSTFVPVATFPGWLQAFAKVNPITLTVDALRALRLGGPTATHVWQALAWIVGLLALTVPVAVLRYRRVTAR